MNRTKRFYQNTVDKGINTKACLRARWVYVPLHANQVHVSKEHNSAEVVTICMLLQQWRYIHHYL
jgi:hypothetical protein